MSLGSGERGGGLAARIALYLGLPLIGLAIFFPGVARSGFRVAMGGPIDVRHAAFVLEWGWLCATGAPVCRDLWSPPIFHPEPETLTLSEPLLGLQPFYAPWRALGAPPAIAELGAKALLLLVLFGASLWLLRRVAGLPPVAAALGAYVAAFGAPRSAQMDHILLFGQAATVLAMGAIALALRDAAPARGRLAVLSAWILAAIQLWSGLYLSWIAALVLAIAALFALASPTLRPACLRTLRRDALAWLVGPPLALLLCAPLVAAFARRLETHRGEALERIGPLVPTLASWVDPGQSHLIWGGLARRLALAPAEYSWEQALGLGVATTLLALLGGALLLRRAQTRPLLLAALAAMALVTRWPGGYSAWEDLFDLLPGASAIRTISRLGVVLLPLWGLAVATGFAALPRRWSRVTVTLIALLLLAESARWQRPFWPTRVALRVEAVARAVRAAGCSAFVLTPRRFPVGAAQLVHLDAMDATLRTGIPTLNGYSSYSPLGWDLSLRNPTDAAQVARFLMAARAWAEQQGLDPTRICWARADQQGRRPYPVEVGLLALDPGEAPPAPVGR